MMYSFSRISLRRMQGVDQRLIDVFDLALSLSPVDFGIAYMGGLRTSDEQYELYMADRTTKDGYNNKSRHQFGEALDFIPYVNTYLLPADHTEHYYFIIIGVIFAAAKQLNIKVTSGANWDNDKIWKADQVFADLPHIELNH